MKNLWPGLALLFLLALTPSTIAAGANTLTEKDYRYLKTEFGVAQDSFTLKNINAEDAKKLHELINEPSTFISASGRHFNVADFLFDAEMRTCQQWELAHANQPCPQVSDPGLMPGWHVAERRCISCHLTGTTSAPSFFKLAQSGTVSEERLATALRGGHQMSPIVLTPNELRELTRYINSLR